MTTAIASTPIDSPPRRARAQWLAPAGLIILSLIPILAGAFRLTELTGGAAITPQNARFFDSPVPVVTHIVSATVFTVLGAFQFVPSLRARGRSWHRIAGRILIPAGLLFALSALWMSVFYPHPAGDGDLLLVIRLVFGSAMVASILFGIRAIRRRDFVVHSAWMTRAYAIGVGAGSQALILIPGAIVFGAKHELSRAVLMTAAWVINLAVAEYVIRRRAGSTGVAMNMPPADRSMMTAAVYHRFGGPEVVHVEEIRRPSPGRDDVLMKVLASTVSSADHRSRDRDVPQGLWLLVRLAMGFFRPRKPVLGMDVAGVVAAVGENVTRFRPGDEVIGMLGGSFGGHAGYARLPQDGAIAAKPANMTFEEAVTLVFGGITARGFLNRADIRPGSSVLVNGASGAVGTAAVQLAKQLGAQVTAVCSAGNRDLVTSLGADRVIEYATNDFTAGGRTWDVIVDCVGNVPFERLERSVNRGGTLLSVIADLSGVLLASSRGRKTGKLVVADVGKYRAEDLEFLVTLAEAGQYRAVIDRSYDLSEIAEAHRYVDTGRKKGNVVVRILAQD